MTRSRSLSVLFAASLLVFAGCNDSSTPTTPTPPVSAPAPAPTPPPTPPPAPPAGPATLASLTLNPETIASQGNPVGTVTLSAAAPSGGAVVALTTGNRDIARTPDSVTIAAGSTSNTFRIDTATVSVPSMVTIEARYEGVSRTAQLTVTPPPLEARFTVTSPTRGADNCNLTFAGMLDCEFNANSSSGVVARYHWTLRIRTSEFSFTASDNQSAIIPPATCGFLGNGIPEDGRVSMEVRLQLEDRSGNRSGTASRTVWIHHNNQCGY